MNEEFSMNGNSLFLQKDAHQFTDLFDSTGRSVRDSYEG